MKKEFSGVYFKEMDSIIENHRGTPTELKRGDTRRSMTESLLEEKTDELTVLEGEIKLLEESYAAGDEGDDDLYNEEVKRMWDLKQELQYLLMRSVKDDLEKVRMTQRVQMELLHGQSVDESPKKQTALKKMTDDAETGDKDKGEIDITEDEFKLLYDHLDPRLLKMNLSKRDLFSKLNSLQGELLQLQTIVRLEESLNDLTALHTFGGEGSDVSIFGNGSVESLASKTSIPTTKKQPKRKINKKGKVSKKPGSILGSGGSLRKKNAKAKWDSSLMETAYGHVRK